MESAKLQADALVQILNAIGIDAAAIGELDLVLGIEFLKELEKKHNFPFICANLVDETNAPIFKPYVIKKVNDKNVGIFGVIGDTSEMVSKVEKITNGAAGVQDPLAAAEAAIKELTGKVDYIIALAHQKTNRNWVISRRVKGIDLVVGGHDKQKTHDPILLIDDHFEHLGTGDLQHLRGCRLGLLGRDRHVLPVLIEYAVVQVHDLCD